MEKVSDYATVVAEIKRRGLWEQVENTEMPNVTLAVREDLSVFYHQREPRVAFWARHDNQRDFLANIDRWTVERNPGRMQVITGEYDEDGSLKYSEPNIGVIVEQPFCSICKKAIPLIRQENGLGYYDCRNAEPVADGDCCPTCDQDLVQPARLREMEAASGDEGNQRFTRTFWKQAR